MTAKQEITGSRRQSVRFWLVGFDLLACLVGFSIAVWLYAGLAAGGFSLNWPAEATRETLVSAFTAWVAIAFTWNPWSDGVRLWIDRLFSAIGFNLMVQYGLDYLFRISPTPWPVAVVGSILAIALIGAFPRRLDPAFPDPAGGTLLLGYDSMAEAVLPALGPSVIGALGEVPPPSFPYLGGLNRFEEVLASRKPGRIVVNDPSWPSLISPRRLLALRYAGVAIQGTPLLFENLLKRVCWERLDPVDLLLSPRLNINRPAIALQAIYTNVIGLALLVLLVPLLIPVAVLTAIATAASPLESVECLGFQRIPFHLLRFRTRRSDGTPVWVGKLLRNLHLINLPQLINVVRGEMALFGPPPVRMEFAEPLAELIPAYAHRFSVKPGVVGWSQANLSTVLPVPDECLRLEYDLYYISEESPSLDLDILFRTLFRVPFRPQ
jgi:lipopolysaccharide/colanic/teichoic acid biosynthesis glycosyltransferase